MKTLDKIKKGEYFTTINVDEPKPKDIWVKDGYDRHEKKYLCHNYANNSRWKYFKGGTIVIDVF